VAGAVPGGAADGAGLPGAAGVPGEPVPPGDPLPDGAGGAGGDDEPGGLVPGALVAGAAWPRPEWPGAGRGPCGLAARAGAGLDGLSAPVTVTTVPGGSCPPGWTDTTRPGRC
jgi:hypothetical protein